MNHVTLKVVHLFIANGMIGNLENAPKLVVLEPAPANPLKSKLVTLKNVQFIANGMNGKLEIVINIVEEDSERTPEQKKLRQNMEESNVPEYQLSSRVAMSMNVLLIAYGANGTLEFAQVSVEGDIKSTFVRSSRKSFLVESHAKETLVLKKNAICTI